MVRENKGKVNIKTSHIQLAGVLSKEKVTYGGRLRPSWE